MAALVLPRPFLPRRRSLVLTPPTTFVKSAPLVRPSRGVGINLDEPQPQNGSRDAVDDRWSNFRSLSLELEESALHTRQNAIAGPSTLSSSPPKGRERRPKSRDQSSVEEHELVLGLEKEKKHVCAHEGCGTAFKKAAKLSDHQLSHSDERPHQCPHCSSRYKKPTHLSAHIRTHLASESKTFVCCKLVSASTHGLGTQKSSPRALASDKWEEEELGNRCAGAGNADAEVLCGKRFWTNQHLQRHEEICGIASATRQDQCDLTETCGQRMVPFTGYLCPDCPSKFRKHRLLQQHYAETHAASHNAFQEDNTSNAGASSHQIGGSVRLLVPVAKRYKCDHGGCDWSFETMQKLRGHAKTHDSSRYICGHEDHSGEIGRPQFRTWTDLQKHMKEGHPPRCPYPECYHRQFTRQSNLKAHLQIHSERGDTLEPVLSPRGLASKLLAADKQGAQREDVDDEVEIETPRRKRKRSEGPDDGLSPKRRLRRASSVGAAVKEWICGNNDCPKSFKTELAMQKHTETAHLGQRPFACSIDGCEKAFGHRHLLQRHIAAKHRSLASKEETQPQPNLIPAHPKIGGIGASHQEPVVSVLDMLTGASRGLAASEAGKMLRCPVGWEDEASSGCQHRCIKVYDLQRHIKKDHGLDLEDVEVRVMLQRNER